jgi:release factor glutamine methyltransferase
VTLKTILDEMNQQLAKAGFEQSHFEARHIVQECLGLTFSQVASQPDHQLSEAEAIKLRDWSTQRAQGVPLAYLSGHKGFYKYDFLVERGVLVPRPETELIVETALRRLDERSVPAQALADLGCGSGCIGLSLAAEMSALRVWAVDINPKACALTTQNAERLGVDVRVRVENRQVERWMPGMHFDIVVANPPYIAEDDPNVQPSVKAFEPKEALFSGEEGLEHIRGWANWAIKHLKPKGIFVCEIGATQSRDVQSLFARVGFDQIQIERDLAGHDRVISGIKAR